MKKAFIHANIIDVLIHKTLRNHTIVVTDNMITEIGASVDTTDCEIIDLAGKYLTPGLFNMHVHTAVPADTKTFTDINCTVAALENMEAYIKSGVTFVRDVGSHGDIMFELRKMVKSGRITMAPDMMLSGHPICMTGGTTWNLVGYEADGEDECRKAARLMLRSGADWLKLMGTGGVVTRGSNPEATQLSVEEMRAIVEEGHKLGVKSCCHVQNISGAKNAILAGVDCLEHGNKLDDEVIEMMLKHGTWLDPTLSAPWCISRYSQDAEFKAKASVGVQYVFDSFKRAHAAGVPCVLANDCGTPNCLHSDTALELVLMVEECGLNPYEAFAIGTINPARLCGVDQELGSVTVGKRAHLAVFANDPIADINAAMDCCMTVKDGTILWDKAKV